MHIWVNVALSAFCCTMLGSAGYAEPEDLSDMPPDERASLVAIIAWHDCMAPVVRKVKNWRPLDDHEVNALGYACPAELRAAAERLSDRNWSAEQVPPSYLAMSREQRILLHEQELAEGFWCEFRQCYIM
ncbi:hypothetical protein [Sphingobium yanoikuyae]|uniref:hypothetical protein n=1 Tax=Sphingobium yanoikuyae TaxID=13690 RepID=UPI00345E44F6